jgi:hypothetical protein
MLITLTALAFACNKKQQQVPHYTVSKVIKSDTSTVVNVHIDSRITTAGLLLIAGKLKTDSAQIQNLAIHYLLPGNADISAGDNSYYASARFIKGNEVKPTDTLKDDNGNVFRVKIFGLSKDAAWKLLTRQPKEIAGKNVVGRFVDDYSHTLIIPFYDPKDIKKELYIIEIDSTAKVVSATIPRLLADDAGDRWVVTNNGDYIMLKDSVLSQFAADGLGVPFNSIKSGR